MSSNPLRLQYLFEKAANNNCTKAELREFWQLMQELDDSDTISGEMEKYWAIAKQEAGGEKMADGPKRLERILKTARDTEPDYVKLHRRRYRPLRTAAAVAAVLILALSVWRPWKPNSGLSPADEQLASVASKHREIRLPDGTKVMLNLGSQLQYPKVFEGGTREVYLTGEGYFEVAHDSTKPFMVHTGSYTTQVLGTVFNVKAYSGNADIEVTVKEGRVKVSDAKRQLGILLPDQRLVIHKASNTAEQDKVNAADITAWKKEDLIFSNSTMEDAAILIDRRFGIKIKFRNEALRNCRFTGTFFSDNGLAQVMDMITSIVNCTWQRQGDTIWLDGEGCTNK